MKKLDPTAVAAAIKRGDSYAAISKGAGGKPGDGTYNAVRKMASELAAKPAARAKAKSKPRTTAA